MPIIETERLKMITLTADMMEAVLKGSGELEKLIPYAVASDWPLDVYKQLFSYKMNKFRKDPLENEWEGAIILKGESRIIGDMGFKGGPDWEGAINLGYSIVPSYQRRGYATEMGKAMVKWGLEQPGVKTIVATCYPTNLASVRVLEKIGLKQVERREDKLYWSTKHNE